ncbi:MAG: polysaccharide deacetylase family protein [bacterium]
MQGFISRISETVRPKEFVIQAARSVGALALVRDSRWRRERLMILCYHGVSVDDEHEWSPTLYISQEQLRNRLRILKRGGYTVLQLSEATRRLYDGTLPPRAVALTFDDGAVDFERRALPVLREFNMPATVYLTSFYCQTRLPVFDTMLNYVLWKGRAGKVDVASLIGSSERLVGDSTPARVHVKNVFRDHATALGLSAEEKDALIGRVTEMLGVDYAKIKARELLSIMTEESVRNLPPELIDVQLHTHRHRTPRDRALFQREIRDNAAVIHELRGADVSLEQFCYPSGDYYGEFFPWLRECGVRYSTTCLPDLASRSAEPMLLPRFVDTMQQSEATFEAWVSGFAALLPRRKEFRVDEDRVSSPEALSAL